MEKPRNNTKRNKEINAPCYNYFIQLIRTNNFIGFIYIISLFFSFQGKLISQSGCIENVGTIYGTPAGNERAKSILPTPGNDGLYIVGFKNDSTLIAKLKLTGEVIWSKTLDIVPNKADNITTAILDNEGKIAAIGIGGSYSNGGTAFAFRFNPDNQSVLWSKEYITNLDRTYAFAIVQKPSGNYVIACDPHNGSENDDEIFEINQTSGAILAGMDKKYNLGGSDASSELIFYQNAIYATGRYTDGGPNDKMRNTIIKFDPNNLGPFWTRLGHISGSGSARLYGKDLIIHQDNIYSTYQGDPAGSSTTDTKLYVQKTDINGNLVWLKQYELPGRNDMAQQLLRSGNGTLVLATENAAPSQIILFKIDDDGAILWAKHFAYPSFISSVAVDRGNNQIQEIAGKIFVSATAVNSNGTTDILLLKLELNGQAHAPCLTAIPVSIGVNNVSSPNWYSVSAAKLNGSQTVNTKTPNAVTSPLPFRPECAVTDTIRQTIQASICEGETYEGYSTSGTFSNYFISSAGCDSIRILELLVSPYIHTTENITICSGQTYGHYSQSGTYTDTLSGFPGSCDTLRIINLYVEPLVTTSVEHVICAGEELFGYTQTGIYFDTLVSASGCDSVRELHLERLEDISIQVTASTCDEINIFHHPPGQYVDTLISIAGCDSVVLLNVEESALYIPNVFSPNQDGINDELRVFTSAELTLNVKYFAIFDRFGNMVYETSGWPISWNGKDRNGQLFQPAVFTYILVYYCSNGKNIMHGDITLAK